MEKEIWRYIPGFYPYQVSSLGRFKGPKSFLKGDIGDMGKTRYVLYKNGQRHKLMGHILVALTFPEICGTWFYGCEVHHKDCNPRNNSACNLLVLSHEEHKNIHRQLGQKMGEKNPFYGKHHSAKTKAKLRKKFRKPIVQIDQNGNEIMCWLSCTDCQKETGMFKACINKCCLGKQNTAYGFKWCYA